MNHETNNNSQQPQPAPSPSHSIHLNIQQQQVQQVPTNSLNMTQKIEKQIYTPVTFPKHTDVQMATAALQQQQQQQKQTQQMAHSLQQQMQQQQQQNHTEKTSGLQGASASKQVDVLIIGGGPAALGILVNAVKTNRLNELMQGDGVAIIDSGLNFGGGLLSRYGINSNTSGGGFLKCSFKKLQLKDNNNVGAAYAQKESNKKGISSQSTANKTAKKKKHKNENNANNGQQTNSRQQINPSTHIERRKTMSNLQNGNTQQQQVQNQDQNNKQPQNELKTQNSLNGAQTMKATILEHALKSNPYNQQLNSTAHKPLNLNQKRDEVEILPPYRDLYNSHIGKVLKEFGKNTAPLGLIGHFLNYAGNHLLNYVYQTTKKKIFFPLHKAVSIQLMSNGEILTKVKRQQVEVNEEGEFVQFVETDQIICFRSKSLVIANGGVQGLHPELFNWFPNLDPKITLASDSFLRSDVYINTMKQIKEQNLKKIVIIGGSHSGFSCAWMLLNGPATYYRNNAGIVVDKEPNAQRKQIKNCFDCCQCGVQQQNAKKAKINEKQGGNSQNSNTGQNSQQQQQQQLQQQSNCQCSCICFGFFQYDDWNFDYQGLIPDYEDYAIEILYRDHIRVFYNKVSDAEMDGYSEFAADKFSKKDGYLYSFTGLRGDAKELYLRIQRGQEKRVALIQAKSVDEQRAYVERADIVIWACGYQTNKLIIKDTDRKKLILSQKVENTQYDVDGKCRIMLADGHVLSKVYGCGIAYPVRTKDGMVVSNPNMTNPRADSFSLYMNFVGDQLLKNLLPKQKYAKTTIHKMIPQKKVNQNENTQANQKNYQQIVKARLQQYKNSIKQVLESHEDKNALRHKSLNAREDFQNNLRKSQISLPQQSNSQQLNDNNQQDNQDIQISQEQLKNLSNINNNGSKSVDRAVYKNGVFQNKLAQMAKSPQLLQKKQQAIKQKNPHYQQTLFSVAENNLHQDVMPLLNHNHNGSNYQQQLHAKQLRLKNEQLKNIKSPYNQGFNKSSLKLGKLDKAQENSQSHTSVPSRQGRDIMRSSQANRKQQDLYVKSTEPPFKMQKQSQGGFGQQSIKHKANRQSMNQNQLIFNNQLYNSQGVNQLSATQSDQLSSMRTDQQKTPFELPPILHPLNQNHYVGMQQQQQQQNQKISSEYYVSNDAQMHCQTQYDHHFTQGVGQDEYTPLQQHSNHPSRQFSFTHHDSYKYIDDLDKQNNYDYTINTDLHQQLTRLDKQEFTPSQIQHSKKTSQILYVQNDDYLSDDSLNYNDRNTSDKKKAQTFQNKFKNLSLNDQKPYHSSQRDHIDNDDDDIQRDDQQNNINLNDNLSESSSSKSSHYNDDHFENDEDQQFCDDVSSEGSCIQTNSYKRSQIDQYDQQPHVQYDNNGNDDDFNMMDEYDRDKELEEEELYQQQLLQEEENVDIPDEEFQDSPRKGLNNIPIQDKEFLANSQRCVGVTHRRILPINENSNNLLISDDDLALQNILSSQNLQQIQLIQPQLQQQQQQSQNPFIKNDKSKFNAKITSIKQGYINNSNVDMKKINKKHLSPVLMNRNSSNNLSNQKSMRDSHEYIKDSKLQSSIINTSNNYGLNNNKKKFLNVQSNFAHNNNNNNINGQRDVQMNDLSSQQLPSQNQQQSNSKSRGVNNNKNMKQTENLKNDKVTNYVRRNYLGQNNNNNSTNINNNNNSISINSSNNQYLVNNGSSQQVGLNSNNTISQKQQTFQQQNMQQTQKKKQQFQQQNGVFSGSSIQNSINTPTASSLQQQQINNNINGTFNIDESIGSSHSHNINNILNANNSNGFRTPGASNKGTNIQNIKNNSQQQTLYNQQMQKQQQQQFKTQIIIN